MTRIGPYSSPDALAKVDGRTREARIVRKVRAELSEHVGGSPSVTQRVMIDRAAALTLQLAQMDAKQADGRSLTDHDARHYLAWTNTLTRLMRQLGLASRAQQPRRLADHIAGRAGGS